MAAPFLELLKGHVQMCVFRKPHNFMATNVKHCLVSFEIVIYEGFCPQ
eukprot:XP_001709934.1 Hypothetical protein GL50803_37874 [Giardia lamblia ATCC 50803]